MSLTINSLVTSSTGWRKTVERGRISDVS